MLWFHVLMTPSVPQTQWKGKKSEIELEDPLPLPRAWDLAGTQKWRDKEKVRKLGLPAYLGPITLLTLTTAPALKPLTTAGDF